MSPSAATRATTHELDGVLPYVSVILPVRNEADFIGRCLEAVVAQDYPADRMEIVVVDGMSTDGTRQIAESFKARHPALRVLDNPGMIVPTALNIAIAAAHGAIIVRVDGHCEIATDYVSGCVAHLQTGVDAVGGPLRTAGESAIARAIALGMSSMFGVGNSAFRTSTGKTMVVDTVAFPAYPRRVLERVGPFDEELVRNQDDEYNYRLRKAGGRILLAADVRADYFSRSSFRSLWRQYFQYGYWKIRVLQKHPRQMCARQFAPVCLVVGTVLSVAVAALGMAPWWVPALVLGSYLSLNVVASVRTARGQPSLCALVFLTFVILHVSYGCGCLRGLIAFRHRWGDERDRSDTRLRPEAVAAKARLSS